MTSHTYAAESLLAGAGEAWKLVNPNDADTARLGNILALLVNKGHKVKFLVVNLSESSGISSYQCSTKDGNNLQIMSLF